MKLINAARATLEFYPIENATSSDPSTIISILPDPEEENRFMKDLIPPSAEIFKDVFFTTPLFPLVSLIKTAEICKIPTFDPYFSSNVNLTVMEKSRRKVRERLFYSLVHGMSIRVCSELDLKTLKMLSILLIYAEEKLITMEVLIISVNNQLLLDPKTNRQYLQFVHPQVEIRHLQ